MDFLTLGGKSDDNCSVNIMVVTYHFTRYVKAYVTPKYTAQVVAQALCYMYKVCFYLLPLYIY